MFDERKTKRATVLLTVLIYIFWPFSSGFAFEAHEILGQWLTEEGDAIIEFYCCEDRYCGRIVWSKNPVYPPNDELGMGGQQRIDRFNPDPRLRNRPLVGLTILRGFTFAGGNLWKGGTIYNPDNGKTYKCRLTLVSRDCLKVRGYLGIPLFGGTSIWTRKQDK